jgi:hypothetical protein
VSLKSRRPASGADPYSAIAARTGRKGPFALYYIQIGVRGSPLSARDSLSHLTQTPPSVADLASPRLPQAKGRSLLAAGYWQPAADSLKKIRQIILEDSASLRKVLKEPNFVKYFGEPDAKKGRTSIFGGDDQLKNAPKMEGVTKDHPEIDLLK